MNTKQLKHVLWLTKWVILFVVVTTRYVRSHEGHQPLPSKGVQVDTKNGHITLSNQARDAIGLKTREIVVGTVSSTLNVYAESIAPWQSTAMGSAQIPGKIAKLLARPGDVVTQGQVIAMLSSRELEAIKLEYMQAENDLTLNQRLATITRPTAQAGAVPMQRLLDIENALAQSQNRVEIARVRARVLGISLDSTAIGEAGELYYSIRSPIAGRIIHSDLAEGKYVEAFEHLFDIVNTEKIWVRLQILEKDLFQVEKGQRVALHFFDSSLTVEGEIDQIDASLDSKTQVSWAWVTIAHPDIIPGLVGKGEISISTQAEKLTVPPGSIFSDGLQNYVFVEEASTRGSSEYRKRNIKLGKRTLASDTDSNRMLEVVEGDIYPGDRVVVKGGHELSSLFFLGILKLSDDDQRRLGIRTSIAGKSEIATTIELPAITTLPPHSRSILSSQVSGTVQWHSLSPGRDVQAGEVLMKIASPDFYQMQLDLLSASLNASLARRRADNLTEAQGDAVSLRLALETTSQAEQLESQVESLKRQLATIGLQESDIRSILHDRQILDYLPLRSHISGRITSSLVILGETVIASQDLAEIQNLDSVWMEAHIPSTEVGSLRSDTLGVATILANSDIKIPVKISRVAPVADQSTRTQRIWLEADSSTNHPLLRANTLLTVSIPLNKAPVAVAVPSTAVIRDGLHFFTFIKMQDGYIQRRRVTTGRSDGEFVEIKEGVDAGESVIASGCRELQTAFASLR